MKKILLLSATVMSLVVGGWYCAENFSGRLSESLELTGYCIIRPGHVVDSVLSGNFHGGFGDWRDPTIKIIFSFFFWLTPFFLYWRTSKKPK